MILYADKAGQVIRVLKSAADRAEFGPPADYAAELELDPETNGHILAIIDGQDGGQTSLEIRAGRLLHRGQEITINAPGSAARARSNAAAVAREWAQSALGGRTPAEIYAGMQSRMDGWSSLADARRDLREWLPLLTAALAWMVVEVSDGGR